MKNQALFSWKDKSKKLKCRLLQFLFGALRVNILTAYFHSAPAYAETQSGHGMQSLLLGYTILDLCILSYGSHTLKGKNLFLE